ncbi:MAG: DUF6934 family protein [Agriterribacter sp.]
MQVEKYHLKSDSTFTRFEFVSEGTKGVIRKFIEFQETNYAGLFNLAFGDKNSSSESIDDLSVSNNGDTEKVLATVISALYAFCDEHPDAFVYASGSTKARTRLYRMGITKYYTQVQVDFYLYGQLGDDFVDFEPGVDYDGFLAQRKFS